MKNRLLSSPTLFAPVMSASWGWLAARGVAAILFGILAFASPGLTAIALVLMWGAYAMVDGGFALAYGVSGGERRWTWILLGVVGILAGVIAFYSPDATAIALAIIVGCRALIGGICELVYAVQNRHASAHPWLIGLDGLLSTLVGIVLVLFVYPVGVLSLVWLLGAYSIAYGVLAVVAGFQLKHFQRQTICGRAASA